MRSFNYKPVMEELPHRGGTPLPEQATVPYNPKDYLIKNDSNQPLVPNGEIEGGGALPSLDIALDEETLTILAQHHPLQSE